MEGRRKWPLRGWHCGLICLFTHHLQSSLVRDWTIFFGWHVKNFFLLHCVPLYVCRLCINYQDLRTKLLGVGALRMLLLTFISTLVMISCPLEKL